MWPEDTPRENRRVFRMEIPKEQIQEFLDSLEQMRHDYEDAALKSKERQGFPEANVVIKHIMGL